LTLLVIEAEKRDDKLFTPLEPAIDERDNDAFWSIDVSRCISTTIAVTSQGTSGDF